MPNLCLVCVSERFLLYTRLQVGIKWFYTFGKSLFFVFALAAMRCKEGLFICQLLSVFETNIFVDINALRANPLYFFDPFDP